MGRYSRTTLGNGGRPLRSEADAENMGMPHRITLRTNKDPQVACSSYAFDFDKTVSGNVEFQLEIASLNLLVTFAKFLLIKKRAFSAVTIHDKVSGK